MDSTHSQQSNGSSQTPLRNDRYTAVVYFHGMGNQRRYEEVSSLLNQFDNLIFRQRPRDRKTLHPTQQNYSESLAYLDLRPIALEQGRRGSAMEGKSVAYYEVRNPLALRTFEDADRSPTVRFYEAYWADHTAGGTNAFSTLNWVVRQWRRPLTVLQAEWGEVWSLRVGTLYGMYEEEQERCWASDCEIDPAFLHKIEYLIDTYRAFVQPDSRYDDVLSNCYRGNSFAEFYTFLEHNLDEHPLIDHASKANLSRDVLNLAKRWQKVDRAAQLRYLSITVMLLVSLGALILLLLWIVYVLVIGVLQFSNDTMSYLVTPLVPVRLTPGRVTFAAILFGLFGLGVFLGFKSFLSDYMGDVHQYLTYQETDTKYARREAILNDSVALMHHVMLDPRCERIAVVAHSLGSVIAYDTLLGLRRMEWLQRSTDTSWDESLELNEQSSGKKRSSAPLRLDKIKHFVTMGSPIDKAIYFFAALQSKVPRFVETVYALRGDISQPPFTWRSQPSFSEDAVMSSEDYIHPHIHWVNYWDGADLISGPIRNIVGTRVSAERVDNVRIAAYRVPEPSRSHGGYFDHRHVLQDIFDIAFKNKYSFVDADNMSRLQQWFAKQDVYRNDKQGYRLFTIQRIVQQSVVVIVTITLMFALMLLTPSLVTLVGALVLTFGAFVVARQALGRFGRIRLLRPRFSVDPHGPLYRPSSPEATLESFLDEELPASPAHPAPPQATPQPATAAQSPPLEVPPDPQMPSTSATSPAKPSEEQRDMIPPDG